VNDRIEAFNQRVATALSHPLFFIAGTERSGTTWLQLLLDAHPEIACRGEGQFMNRLFPQMSEVFKGYRGAVQAFNTGYFRDTSGFPILTDDEERFVKQTYLALLIAKFDSTGQAKIFGEKTPANVRCLDRIRYIAPQSKIVFIVRDGRDVGVSAWHHGKASRYQRDGNETLPETIHRVATAWAGDMRRIIQHQMASPETSILVRYEDLYEKPAENLANIFSFLGASLDDGVLKDCQEAADFSRFSDGRKRGEEDKSAQFRKGIIGDWQNYDEQGRIQATFQDIADDELRHFRYL